MFLTLDGHSLWPSSIKIYPLNGSVVGAATKGVVNTPLELYPVSLIGLWFEEGEGCSPRETSLFPESSVQVEIDRPGDGPPARNNGSCGDVTISLINK